MNLKGYKSIQNSRISDDMDEHNSVDREVELLQDLYSDYTDDLEEMRSNYANGREDTATVEDWEQAYRALIDEIRGLDIENPQEVYDTLVDWNWHRLTWCMCLAGKLGQGELNEAVDWLRKYAYDDKSYLALKNIANSDFGGSKVGDSRRVSDSNNFSREDNDYIADLIFDYLDNDKKITFDYTGHWYFVDIIAFRALDILNGGTSLCEYVDNLVLDNADAILEEGDACIGYRINFVPSNDGKTIGFSVWVNLISDNVYHDYTRLDPNKEFIYDKQIPNNPKSIRSVVKEITDIINSIQLGVII